MTLYLPVAEMAVNAPLMVLLGAVVGFVSGMFGIGGGFLMTPALVFLGVPPAVAVASQTGHVAASSTTGAINYHRRAGVDFRMGLVLAAGGAVGSLLGVEAFRILRLLGQADLVVAVSYLVFLAGIGGLMINDSARAILRRRMGRPQPAETHKRPVWLSGLPLKMRFPKSRLYMSVIPPLGLGAGVGVLSAIMGVGGGFILVPAMIYLLRIPAAMVVGTSLFQITVTTCLVMLLQAGRNQTVDILLSTLLLVGGVVGAQLGAQASTRFRPDVLRAALGVLVLLTGVYMGLTLFVTPADPFAVAPL